MKRLPYIPVVLVAVAVAATLSLEPIPVLAQPLGTDFDEGSTARLLVATDDSRALSSIPGLFLRSCRQGLCTAEVLVEDFDASQLSHVAGYVERSGRRRPMLDRSLPMAGVTDGLRADGFTGQGVLVAVIDSGIDWRHGDFARDDEVTTRIEVVVDLSLPPTGHLPELEDAIDAAVWTRTDIEAHLDAEERGETPDIPVETADHFGHGTHVASVAAGGRGVAPEASLLVVRASREDWPVVFEDADVLESARLVFDLAEQLDMPAVLILALGGHQGPHDGTSLLELGLSDLVGPEYPGRAIVVAAGNSGGCQDHARGELRRGAVDVILEVTGEDPSLVIDLELWAPPSSALDISVTTTDGEQLGPVEAGEESNGPNDAAWISIRNAPDGPDGRNGDLQTIIEWRSQLSGAIAPGLYRVTVNGHGQFDAYLSWASSEQLSGAARLLTMLEPDGTLTVPGTAPELIVVGASVSRRGWTDVDGRTWLDDRYDVGMVAPYTGSGPNRTGDLKPDLVAPGHAVIAAMSADAEAGNEGSLFTPTSSFLPERHLVVPPGDSAVLWGTSVAAPHVAGVVALLFQLDPALTQDEIQEILVATARTSGGAGGRAWSPRWGFGELDAAAALRLLRDGFGERVSPDMSALGAAHDVLAPDGCTTIVVVPKDESGFPVGPGLLVEVEASVGPTTAPRDEGDGMYSSRYCTGSAPLGTAITITARADGVTIDHTVEILIAEDRAHLGAWATARGGCSSVTTDHGGASWWQGLLTP